MEKNTGTVRLIPCTDIFKDTDSLPEEASHIERKMTRRRENHFSHFSLAVGETYNRRPLFSRLNSGSLATGETLVTSNQSCRDIKGFYKFAVML